MLSRVVRLFNVYIYKEYMLKINLESLKLYIDNNIDSTFEINQVNNNNINDVESFRGANTALLFKKYLADGCIGMYIYHNNAVIGHAWMEINTLTSVKISKEDILLLPFEGGVWYENINEEYRGRHLIQHLFFKLYKKALSHKCKNLLVHILKDNQSSLKAHNRFIGTKNISYATLIKMLNNHLVIYKAKDRFLSFIVIPKSAKKIGFAWSKYSGLTSAYS